MISLAGVSKRYGSSVALVGVDLEVGEGEALAVFGHNGSGKTTLLKLVAGLLRPTAGTVRVAGSAPRAMRARIGYVGHQPYLYPYLSAAENLAFYARLYGVPAARGADLLEQVGMGRKRDALVHTFSRGETQRVSIARALLHDPDVLLADEPFAGLDPPAAAAVPALLRRQGRTVLLASHDRAQALSVCDGAVTLERGRLEDARRRASASTERSVLPSAQNPSAQPAAPPPSGGRDRPARGRAVGGGRP